MTFTCTNGSRRSSASQVIRVAPLPESDVAPAGMVLVTSAARTVVDCARTLPGADALAIADRALRVGPLTHGDLRQGVERAKGWPGSAQARRVVELADGRRESPLESWSAWSFAEQGVPPPQWQVVICDREGVFLGRADAWWRQGVAGEADGRLKYRLAALERGGIGAESLAAVLDDERRRELEMRRAGVIVVRWGAVDVRRPSRAAALASQLRAEVARAEPGTFRGTVTTA